MMTDGEVDTLLSRARVLAWEVPQDTIEEQRPLRVQSGVKDPDNIALR
jgi:hypothetical protein